MSISSLFTDIKTKIFGSNKPITLAKITPIYDTEYTPDLEAGEGGFYKRIKVRQAALEFISKPLNHDVEKAILALFAVKCPLILMDMKSVKL